LKDPETILINDELIARYLAGEASPEEAIALHEWLEKPENKLYFAGFEKTWDQSNPSQNSLEVDVDNDWRTVSKDFGAASPTKIRALTASSLMMRMAAVLAIALGLGFFFYLRKENATIQKIASTTIETLVFADSSTAVLNKEAAISYPEHFGKSRQVVLSKGEAFFKVTHNGKPFVVHTAVADIHVIGTSFNVRFSEGKLNITVEEGKVLITTAQDSAFLDPGYTGSVLSDTTPIKVTPADDKNVASYATRKFIFEDTPLQQVFEVMQKAYPYSFTMENAGIGSCKLTASFEDVTAEYMLHLIAESLNLEIKKK
jgi:transmembrane sensor